MALLLPATKCPIGAFLKFDGIIHDTLSAIKETVLPALMSKVINGKFKGKQEPNAAYIASICASKTLMIGIIEKETVELIPLSDNVIFRSA